MLLGRLVRIAALLLPALVAAEEDDLRQLTDDTFKKSVAHGAWLVEHYSPRCPHCRAFAPTWGKLAKDLKHYEQLSGFHMAQVNCLAQGDLCSDNGITGYPQINLYMDGQFVSEYKKDRNYDFLRQFIEAEAVNYARSIVLGSSEDASATANTAYVRRPNPEGKVVEVDHTGLDRYKAAGPVFIDFYAPWCSHCKALRPTLENLASELQGRLNIVAVNCDDNPHLCRANGVEGYPTLKLGNDTSYNKARSLAAMKEFLKPVTPEPAMVPMKAESLPLIAADEDNFIIYLQNWGTKLEDLVNVEKSIQPLHGQVPFFTTNDPLVYSNLSIEMPPPSSMLAAFAGHSTTPLATLALPAEDPDAVNKFLTKHRYPLLTNITTENIQEVMKAPEAPLVVLGVVHSDVRGADERKIMENIARSFRHGSRPQQRPVRFATLNDTWITNMKHAYGLVAEDVPAVVVVDAAADVYFDLTAAGQRAGFNGADAFSILESIWQESATPKPIEAPELTGGISWRRAHPIQAAFLAAASALALVYIVLRFRRRRGGVDLLPSHRGGFMNEKGLSPKRGHRLD